MEVSGPDYQLVALRRTRAGHFYLVWDEKYKMYLYLKRKGGATLVSEDAGNCEADAIEGFKNFIASNIF